MPEIKTDDGCIIHVEVEGAQDGPVLMLSNSLGTNLHMWGDGHAWDRKRLHNACKSRKTRYNPQNLGSMRKQESASQCFPCASQFWAKGVVHETDQGQRCQDHSASRQE
jgi:hypothetical protein